MSFAPCVSHRVAVEVSVVATSTPCLQLDRQFCSAPEDNTVNFVVFPSIFLLLHYAGWSSHSIVRRWTFWKHWFPPLFAPILSSERSLPLFEKGCWTRFVSSCGPKPSEMLLLWSGWSTRKPAVLLCVRPPLLCLAWLHWKPIHQCENIFKALEKVWGVVGTRVGPASNNSYPAFVESFVGIIWTEVQWRLRARPDKGGLFNSTRINFTQLSWCFKPSSLNAYLKTQHPLHDLFAFKPSQNHKYKFCAFESVKNLQPCPSWGVSMQVSCSVNVRIFETSCDQNQTQTQTAGANTNTWVVSNMQVHHLLSKRWKCQQSKRKSWVRWTNACEPCKCVASLNCNSLSVRVTIIQEQMLNEPRKYLDI